MILLRIRDFWILVLLALFCVLGMGVYGWIVFQSPDIVGQVLDSHTAKRLGEGVLFLGTVLMFGLLATGLFIGLRTRRNRRRAESLLSRGQWMKAGPEKWSSILGDLGEGIYRMNRDLLETNARRGIKIQGISVLVTFLVQNFNEPIIVTNAFGEIVYVSAEYLDKADLNRTEILQQNIEERLEGVRLNHLRSEFLKSPTSREIQAGGRRYSVFPIRDTRNETVYLIFSLGSKTYRIDETEDEEEHGPVPVTDSTGGATDWIRQGIGKMLARRKR